MLMGMHAASRAVLKREAGVAKLDGGRSLLDAILVSW